MSLHKNTQPAPTWFGASVSVAVFSVLLAQINKSSLVRPFSVRWMVLAPLPTALLLTAELQSGCNHLLSCSFRPQLLSVFSSRSFPPPAKVRQAPCERRGDIGVHGRRCLIDRRICELTPPLKLSIFDEVFLAATCGLFKNGHVHLLT